MRPLFDEDGSEPASEVSRDYVFELEHESGAAPLLNVFGGKITTYRRLSEHALQKLKPFFPAAKGDWTARAKLPGGRYYDATVIDTAKGERWFCTEAEAVAAGWRRSKL